jgi:hypothetical protein
LVLALMWQQAQQQLGAVASPVLLVPEQEMNMRTKR